MATRVNNKRIVYTDDIKPDIYSRDLDVILALGDSIELLNKIPDGSINMIVTSPPYNIGKCYKGQLEFSEFIEWQRKVAQECVRVLAPNGSLCWQLGNYNNDDEQYPLDIFFYGIAKTLKLKLKNRIIWRCERMSGHQAKLKFSQRYQTIMWFVKSDDYTFNLDPVRVAQKYPERKRGFGFMGKHYSKGKNPSEPRIGTKKYGISPI